MLVTSGPPFLKRFVACQRTSVMDCLKNLYCVIVNGTASCVSKSRAQINLTAGPRLPITALGCSAMRETETLHQRLSANLPLVVFLGFYFAATVLDNRVLERTEFSRL